MFRLQFDEFQIVSSSHDDTILIWDFLNTDPDVPNLALDNGQQIFDQQQMLPEQIEQENVFENNNMEVDEQQNIPGPANVNAAAVIGIVDDDEEMADIPGPPQLHNGPHELPNNVHFQQQQQLRNQIQEQHQQLQQQNIAVEAEHPDADLQIFDQDNQNA